MWTIDPIDGTRILRGKKFAVCLVDGKVQLVRKFSLTEETKIQMANIFSVLEASFRESVEAEHSSHGDAAKIASLH
ncbi:7138_t:CDS:2, partial [Funneliformis mosseae]